MGHSSVNRVFQERRSCNEGRLPGAKRALRQRTARLPFVTAPGSDGGPSRIWLTLDGWRNTDLNGNPLKVGKLSSRLTETSNFRATICTVPEHDYLSRRINALEAGGTAIPLPGIISDVAASITGASTRTT